MNGRQLHCVFEGIRFLVLPLAVLSATTFVACLGEDSIQPVVVTDSGADPNDAMTTTTFPSDGGVESTPDSSTSCWERPFGPPVLVGALNTPGVDLNIRVSADERTAYFTTARDGGAGGADLWMATRPTVEDDWGSPENMAELNTPTDEVHGSVSPTDLSFFFARGVFPDGGNVNTDLFVVNRPSSFPPPPFKDFPAQNLSGLNSPANDTMPYATNGGLYFTSDRDGESKIYYSRRNGSSFDAPAVVPLSYEPGTLTNLPVASADGLRLYFASNRTGSVGALDIYVATRESVSAPFGVPSSVMELNTPSNDRPGAISADGCRIYLTSDRAGSTGGLDIWRATRTP